MKKLLVVLAVLGLSGCAMMGDTKVSEGAAVYKLKSPDCEVEVVSARSFSGEVVVGNDCSFAASVETTRQDLAREILEFLK